MRFILKNIIGGIVMKKKKSSQVQDAKLNKAMKHSEDSRNSNNGYMERGNDATIHAKARACNNNDNGSHM